MKDQEKDRTMNRTHSDDPYKSNHTAGGTSNLVRLKDADDLKIVKDDPDVRGWPVLTSDNMEVGKVDELVVDTSAMKVRYMVVDLYDDYAADKIDHYLLLPIGAARLHEKDNKVLVSGIKTTTVLNYPVYRNTDISRDYEHSVRSFFNSGGATMTPTSGTAAGAVGGATIAETTDRPSATPNRLDDASSGRTIVRTDEDHIHGHATSKDHVTPTGNTNTPNIHGTTGRHHVESSHMQSPDRIDTTRADEDSIRGTRETGERRHPDTGQKTFGESNFTTGADFNQRTQTSGLTPRTTHLENKEIEQGPSGTHKTEWDAQRPHKQEGEWSDTSNLNSSNSLSSEPKRGSNLGNVENRPQYNTDRERLASPEQVTRRPGDPSTNDFYDHEHFDEEVFYRVRRRKNNREE